MDLLDTDIKMVRKQNGVDFIIRFMRISVAWRNLIAIVGDATTHSYFTLPHVFFRSDIPDDWKREFIRGYADVAGNVRHANRYIDGRHRVRLDVLNYSTNWEMPVQLCTLLQEQLGIPVQLITWGHPNMGRKFREHQINIFIEPFSKIGFSFAHKQTILNEFREYDKTHLKPIEYLPCPGMRKRSKSKPHDPDENNAEKLDDRLLSHHYDAYWQICHSLGCTKTLDLNEQ